MKKLFLLTLPIIALFAGCKKEEPVREYKIHGRLYNSCGGTPRPNVPLELYQTENYKQYATAVTNSQGEYSFTFSASKAGMLAIAVNDPILYHRIVENVGLVNRELDLYMQPTAKVMIRVNPTHAYSADDTLFYFGKNNTQEKYKIGPFVAGIIDTIEINSNMLTGGLNLGNYQGNWVKADLRWGLGYKDFFQSAVSGQSGRPIYHQIDVPISGICSRNEVLIPLP